LNQVLWLPKLRRGSWQGSVGKNGKHSAISHQLSAFHITKSSMA